MKAAVILLLTSLTGCGITHQYVHSDSTKTQAQFQAEAYDCQQVGYQYAANIRDPGNPFIIAREYDNCMKLKYGYRLVPK